MKLPFIVERPLLVFGIPSLVLLFSLFILFAGWTKSHPELYTGITYDIVLTVPVSLYFLSGRKLPKSLFAILVGIGILICWIVIPVEYQFHLSILRITVLPLLELISIIGLIRFTRKILKELRQSGNTTPDHLMIFRESGLTVTGNRFISQFLGTELAMLYYAFFIWKKRPYGKNEFSYHRDNGTIALLSAFAFLILIETAAVHLIIAQWSELTAWILTAMSFYSFLFLVAHIKAIIHRPHLIGTTEIQLRNGLFGTASIPYSRIAAIEITSNEPVTERKCIKRFFPFANKESHNVILHLHQSLEIESIYGITQSCDTLLLQIDNKSLFEAEIKKRCL